MAPLQPGLYSLSPPTPCPPLWLAWLCTYPTGSLHPTILGWVLLRVPWVSSSHPEIPVLGPTSSPKSYLEPPQPQALCTPLPLTSLLSKGPSLEIMRACWLALLCALSSCPSAIRCWSGKFVSFTLSPSCGAAPGPGPCLAGAERGASDSPVGSQGQERPSLAQAQGRIWSGVSRKGGSGGGRWGGDCPSGAHLLQ